MSVVLFGMRQSNIGAGEMDERKADFQEGSEIYPMQSGYFNKLAFLWHLAFAQYLHKSLIAVFVVPSCLDVRSQSRSIVIDCANP
jgi:hypothetical protein